MTLFNKIKHQVKYQNSFNNYILNDIEEDIIQESFVQLCDDFLRLSKLSFDFNLTSVMNRKIAFVIFTYLSNIDNEEKVKVYREISYNGEEIIDKLLIKELIDRYLDKLTEIERSIIELRFGLNDNIYHTLIEVSNLTMKCTKERIRQIEFIALNKMKQNYINNKNMDGMVLLMSSNDNEKDSPVKIINEDATNIAFGVDPLEVEVKKK